MHPGTSSRSSRCQVPTGANHTGSIVCRSFPSETSTRHNNYLLNHLGTPGFFSAGFPAVGGWAVAAMAACCCSPSFAAEASPLSPSEKSNPLRSRMKGASKDWASKGKASAASPAQRTSSEAAKPIQAPGASLSEGRLEAAPCISPTSHLCAALQYMGQFATEDMVRGHRHTAGRRTRRTNLRRAGVL